MPTKRFRKIEEKDLEMIMNWRMSPDITKFMYTDPSLTLESQREWLEKMRKDDTQMYWIFEVDGVPGGVVSLTDWNKKNKSINTGAYIANKELRTLENIIDMNMNLYNTAFSLFGVNRVSVEIMSNNEGQIRWAERMGAIKEGVLRQVIQKDGKYYDLHVFSYLAVEWEEIKKTIKHRLIDVEV